MSLDDLEHIKNMDFEFLHVGDLTIVGPAYQQLRGFIGQKHTRSIDALLELSSKLEAYELGNFEDGDAWITTCLYRGFGFKVMFIRSRFYVVRIFEGFGNHEAPVINHGIIVSTRGHKPRVSRLEGRGTVMSHLSFINPTATDTVWASVSYRLAIDIAFDFASDPLAYDKSSGSMMLCDDAGAAIWCGWLLPDAAETYPRRADAWTGSDTGASLTRCRHLNDAVLVSSGNGWVLASSWMPKGIVIDVTYDGGDSGSLVPGDDAGAAIWCGQLLASDSWVTQKSDLS